MATWESWGVLSLYNCLQEAQDELGVESINSQQSTYLYRWTFSSKLQPPEGSIISPNSGTNDKPSIQIHELFFIQAIIKRFVLAHSWRGAGHLGRGGTVKGSWVVEHMASTVRKQSSECRHSADFLLIRSSMASPIFNVGLPNSVKPF